MKKLLIIFVLLMSAGIAVHSFAQTNIAGTYWVKGTNPGGKGAYQGIATVIKSGDSYRIHWEVGTIYDGVGKLNGGVLTVEWGNTKENVGTVTYNLQPDGSLKGTWFTARNPTDLGTETLTPKK